MVPVIDDDKKLLGIITISDLKIAQIKDKRDEKVIENAKKHITVIYAQQSVNEALDVFNRYGIRFAPVINNDADKKLIGILSKSDILRCFETERIKHSEKEK